MNLSSSSSPTKECYFFNINRTKNENRKEKTWTIMHGTRKVLSKKLSIFKEKLSTIQWQIKEENA